MSKKMRLASYLELIYLNLINFLAESTMIWNNIFAELDKVIDIISLF